MKIISGGQTGVDRAALDVAITLGIPHGGWCPKGRLAVDGPIDLIYQLKETASSDYAERTKRNIQDSDATIVIIPADLAKITNGTQLTIAEAQRRHKPLLIIKTTDVINAVEIRHWIHHHNIHTLNFAGPRESSAPGIYQQSFRIIEVICQFIVS